MLERVQAESCQNSRVLAWVFRRCDDEADAVETPIGLVPAEGSLDTDGLGMTADELAALLEVDSGEWKAELPLIQEHFATFGDRLPQTLRDELDALEQRLESTPG